MESCKCERLEILRKTITVKFVSIPEEQGVDLVLYYCPDCGRQTINTSRLYLVREL